MNKDDMSDDAEFDAFLKGEGELSRQLQAMPQASPSAELDAAILDRVKQDLARENRPQAANDAGDDVPAPRLARGLGARWRIPAGIAATVLIGVMAKQSFESDTEGRFDALPQETVVAEAVIVPEPPATISAPPAVVAPEVKAPAAPEPAKRARAPRPPIVEVQAARDKYAPAPASAPVMEAAPAPAPPAPAPEVAAVPPPPPAEQVAAAAVARKAVADDARERVEITGSRIIQGYSQRSAENWIVEIEKLLKQERNAEALAEWKKFREAYPGQKVSPELEAKMDALRD